MTSVVCLSVSQITSLSATRAEQMLPGVVAEHNLHNYGSYLEKDAIHFKSTRQAFYSPLLTDCVGFAGCCLRCRRRPGEGTPANGGRR